MRAFNLHHALTSWRRLYPDPEKRIEALRAELERCYGTVRDRRGHMVTREYPQTVAAIREMIGALERGAG